MRVCVLVLLIVGLFAVDAVAQIAIPSPTPARHGNPILADNGSFDRLRSIEMLNPKERMKNHPLLDPNKGIYRRPDKQETEVLAPDEVLVERHQAFLKQPDTGIVKLSADHNCISVNDVVVATEKCLALKMPGAGAAFSFRTETYRLLRLADLILLGGEFRTGGIFQNVVMTSLGDVPIEDVSLTSRGMKFLAELKPVSDSEEFLRFDEKAVSGIAADGFVYRKAHAVKQDATFALRSIAYRGSYMRSVDGIVYNELEMDKRRDVIVIFRVIEQEANGNVTLLWKRLRDSSAPKLEVKK